MHVKRYIPLLVCLLACVVAFAQGTKTAPMSVTDNGDGTLKVHFQLPSTRTIPVDEHYSTLVAEGMISGTGHVGCPDLPTASILVRLPEGCRLMLNHLDGDNLKSLAPINSHRILTPVTEGWVKDQPRPVYTPNLKVYETDEFYLGGDLLEVEHLGRMGREEIYRLTVRPFMYNPVSGKIIAYQSVDANLNMEKSSSSQISSSEDVLLIVSRSEFETGLQPFVQWKRQEGYTVEELYVETNLRDDIKELIRPWFDDADAVTPSPKYILLVGDAAQIQSFIGETSLEGEGHTTDLYYAEFTGDYLPEALLGRWPVNDTAELHVVVEKTLRYEQFRDMDTLQLKRMMLVAGEENSNPAPLTTNSQVDYVGREAKLAHSEIDTICFHNPQSGSQLDTIKAEIGNGAGLLNYTAHCTVGGWTSPALTIVRVTEAHGTQPMVYVNNCCKSNNFSGTGFGEQLLRLPEGGGVGVIGATNSTLWYEDYYWAVGPKIPVVAHAIYNPDTRGAFDALVGSEPTISTLGELLATGNLAVSASGSSYGRFYWEIYCLLGDPTLMPYIGMPRRVTLTLTDSLYNGQSEITVAGTPGARVTAVQDGMLLGVADIGSNGHAILRLRQTLDTLPLLITATGHGLQPRVDTVTVSGDIEWGVALRDVTICDSDVTCTVENIGRRRIDSLHVVLTQQNEDTLGGALIAERIVIVDSLSAGDHLPVTLPVNIEAIGELPLWQATLMAVDTGRDTLCTLPLRRSMSVVYPTLNLHLLDSQGREARRLLPGREYRLVAKMSGPEGALTLEAESLPSQGIQTTHDSILTLTTPDSLCGLRIAGSLLWERWRDDQEYWLEPGDLTDGFENGLESHPWRNDSRSPWILDATESHSGNISMRSGVIDHGQSTSLCIEVLLPHSDTVSYWVKTSTEAQYDKLSFSVDGSVYRPEAWGVEGWRQRTHQIQPGRHTLCWRYVKDASTSQGSDCVWIDDVRLPFSLWDTLCHWGCRTTTMGIVETSSIPLQIFPNPSGGEMWISGPRGTEVYVTDLMGRKVAMLRLTAGGPILWDATALPSGVYFARCRLNDNCTTYKIILRKD